MLGGESELSLFREQVSTSEFNRLPDVIGKRYLFRELLGKGSFGLVFVSESIESHKLYATKVELANNRSPKLEKEFLKGKLLEQFEGFPEMRYYWSNREYNALVMELLGENLDDLHKKCGRRFSIVNVAKIAIQLFSRLEVFHKQGFIHRDIKPENFLIGTGENEDILYLIDYGLSKEYIDKSTGQHIPFMNNHGVVGTLRYISVNTHNEIEPTRRDDLMALCYVLVYLFKGSLPWQFKDKMSLPERVEKIKIYKQEYPDTYLYHEMPIEFLNMHRAIASLSYEQEPNYNALRLSMHSFLQRMKSYNMPYDWKRKNDLIPSDGQVVSALPPINNPMQTIAIPAKTGKIDNNNNNVNDEINAEGKRN